MREYEHVTRDTLERPPKERHARHCTSADEEAVFLGIQKLVQERSSAAFAGSLTRVPLAGRLRGSLTRMPLAATPRTMPLVQPHTSRGGVDISFEGCRGLEHMYAQVNVRRGRGSGRPPCTRPPCSFTSPPCPFGTRRANGRGNTSTRSIRNTANTAAIGTCEASGSEASESRRGAEASESRRGGRLTPRRSLPDSRRGGALTPKRLKMEADSERSRSSKSQPPPHRHEQEPERHAEGARQEGETGDATIHSITKLPTYTRQREEEGVRGWGSMLGVCDEADSEAETHKHKYVDTERDGDGGGSQRCQSASHTCHTRQLACKVDRQVPGQWSGEEVSGAGDESREEPADKESREHPEDKQKGKGRMEGVDGVKGGSEEQVEGGAEEQVGVDATGEEEEDMYMLRTRMAQSLVSLSLSLSLSLSHN